MNIGKPATGKAEQADHADSSESTEKTRTTKHSYRCIHFYRNAGIRLLCIDSLPGFQSG